MTVLWILLGVGVLGITTLLLESIREGRDFVITHYRIPSLKHEIISDGASEVPLKAILITDLHDKEYGVKNEKLVEAVGATKPDMILIAGDMIIAKNGRTPDVALNLIGELSKIAPIYYGNGNHEQRVKEDIEKFGEAYERYRESLRDRGVHVLENDTTQVTIRGRKIYISGLEIPAHYYVKGQYGRVQKGEITDLLGEKPEGYHILLAHNPVHSDAYVQWGADLVLSGHLHGGIIRLPWIGGIITPQVQLFPKYSGGMYKKDYATIVVSKGLGEHTVKIRFLNKPELVVLEIQ